MLYKINLVDKIKWVDKFKLMLEKIFNNILILLTIIIKTIQLQMDIMI